MYIRHCILTINQSKPKINIFNLQVDCTPYGYHLTYASPYFTNGINRPIDALRDLNLDYDIIYYLNNNVLSY